MQWRARINQELKSNELGFLPHRSILSLPSDFPSLDVLRKHANPLITGTEQVASVALKDTANLDLALVAQLCEEFFEWGYQGDDPSTFPKFHVERCGDACTTPCSS